MGIPIQVSKLASLHRRTSEMAMESNSGSNVHIELAAAIDALRMSERRLAVATEALRKSEEQATAGRLALEIMHEVRNPLEALGHLTYLALQEAEHPERVRKYMLLATEQMANLGHIVSQTLGFAHQSEKPRPVDLAVFSRSRTPHSSANHCTETNSPRERSPGWGSDRRVHRGDAAGCF